MCVDPAREAARERDSLGRRCEKLRLELQAANARNEELKAQLERQAKMLEAAA